MTRQPCERVWELFDQLGEEDMAAAIADGTVATQLKETNGACAKLFATHKLSLTGVLMFPNHPGKALERAPCPAAPKLGGIPSACDSQVFEDLRDRSKATKKTSTTLLTYLGTRRGLGGRESFTSNLYRVGGVNTVVTEGINPEVFVKAMQEAGADIAVLCSSARVYAVRGLAVAKTPKETDAQEIRLARQLKELGGDKAEVNTAIDGNVFGGMNVVELLTSTLDKLEA